ncbi:MAG: AAA family ATPase [SAR324 cluster bacterium]|nr:AAA family ATPase [SAR324 cluster bacterium]
MMIIPGYQIQEQLYEGENSMVFRAVTDVNSQPVILKFLKNEYPSPEEVAQFRHEYEILKKIQFPGIVKVYDLVKHQNSLVLVLDDLGGNSLHKRKSSFGSDIPGFLEMAIQSLNILENIHQHRVIHKDINPANLVFSNETGQVSFIDFGISTELSYEIQSIQHPNVLEGTLAYISPEQTGRMNCAIDHRTDLYSLGITFYEILSGQLPFDAEDAIGWVHCHIAHPPKPLKEANPAIPQALSDIIMKMISKSVEDRYRSARGVRNDMLQCQEELKLHGHIEPFAPGLKDMSGQFQIPQKLYGREKNVQELRDCFNLMLNEGTKMMLISGQSGVGKTALVQEILKKLTEQDGHYISGKFDQFKRNEPYSALAQAFKELIRQLLSESSNKLNVWKNGLLQALGTNAGIVIDLIPDLELILGEQPEVPVLGSIENQNRFQRVFQQFIRVFAQKEHPLVMFLDDLQWADSSTLILLKNLMSGMSDSYLLFIGAYRSNEVDPAHPFKMTMEEIVRGGQTFQELILEPLVVSDVNQLVSDTLRSSMDEVASLGYLVFKKTGGNPFFIGEFLKHLHRQKLLAFDPDTLKWNWDLSKIKEEQTTDNVVDLMIAKIERLPDETQAALKMAACIGPSFDLQTLAILCDRSLRKISIDLWSAVQEGLVMPLSGHHKLLISMEEADAVVLGEKYPLITDKFLHDRIQQAAHGLIEPEQQKTIHWRIGQFLLKHLSAERLEEQLFYVLSQLNAGREIRDEADSVPLAELNLQASRKARISAAYGPGTGHAEIGIECLGEQGWDRHYSLLLSLYSEAAENAYLNRQFDLMETFVQKIIACGKTVLDKVPAYESRIHGYIAQNRELKAVQTALIILRSLGVNLPSNPGKLHVALSLIKTKITLMGHKTADLANLPRMTQPEKLAASRILSSLMAPSYIALPDLMPITVFTNVQLVVKYGNNPYSYISLTAFGSITASALGNPSAGYEFGELALKLMEQNQEYQSRTQILFLISTFLQHWKESVGKSISMLEPVCQIGIEKGDFEFAALAAHNNCALSFLAGINLHEVLDKILRYNRILEQIRQVTPLHYNHMYQQVVLNLTSEVDVPQKIKGEVYDEAVMLPKHQDAHDNAAIFSLFLNKLILCFMFEQWDEGLNNANENLKYVEAAMGMVHVPIFYFYDALIHLAVAGNKPAKEQKKYLSRAGKDLKRLKKWNESAPMNQLQRCLLIEAEIARVRKEDLHAMTLYRQAIEAAKTNNYQQEAAIACELTARFYLARKEEEIARLFFRDALFLYRQWGADAKIKFFEKTYPAMVPKQVEQTTSGLQNARKTISAKTVPTTRNIGGSLDLMTVIKASQTISGEIVLEQLLEKLLLIIIENAGADRGLLLREKDGLIQIEASKDISQSITESASQRMVPESLIRYAMRTRENIVINDVTRNDKFFTDPYFVNSTAKSILCMPMLHKGELFQTLYLENRMTPGAFTEDRLEILNILSTQAAISIENAQLYANLGNSVRMEAELKTAAAVQHALLPLKIPVIPGMDIAGYFKSASETGGDWYGFMTQIENHLYVMIGDVTGHGSPAALVTAAASTACGVLEELAEGQAPDLPKVLFHLNRAIFRTGRTRYLMTFFIAAIELKTGVMRFANAGHNFPLCLDQQGKVKKLLNRNIRLGEMETLEFTESSQQLSQGDFLFFYTDGLTENMSPEREEWGEKRLRNFLRDHREEACQHILNGLETEMNAFNQGLPLEDDVTMVAVKITGDFPLTS